MANVHKIIDLARKRGITLSFLSRELGKRRTFLSEAECRGGSIAPEDLQRIAAMLSTTVAYLCDETENPDLPYDPDWEILASALRAKPLLRDLTAIASTMNEEELARALRVMAALK